MYPQCLSVLSASLGIDAGASGRLQPPRGRVRSAGHVHPCRDDGQVHAATDQAGATISAAMAWNIENLSAPISGGLTIVAAGAKWSNVLM
jgi:hypothetical protein